MQKRDFGYMVESILNGSLCFIMRISDGFSLLSEIHTAVHLPTIFNGQIRAVENRVLILIT